jgi:E3 ubiquitin-protein ligase SIAH1
MLLAHLAAAPHSWPVDKLQYGEALRIRVPDTEPRRLLVAEEDGGERVFVLAVGDRAARAIPVRVACVRAPDAAAAGPQFTLKMWATGCKAPASGKVESVLVDMEVPSAAAAGAVAAERRARSCWCRATCSAARPVSCTSVSASTRPRSDGHARLNQALRQWR